MAPKHVRGTGGTCPIRGRPDVRSYRPFCSRRCADVDLARWLAGAYAIPERGENEDAIVPAAALVGGTNGKAGSTAEPSP